MKRTLSSTFRAPRRVPSPAADANAAPPRAPERPLSAEQPQQQRPSAASFQAPRLTQAAAARPSSSAAAPAPSPPVTTTTRPAPQPQPQHAAASHAQAPAAKKPAVAVTLPPGPTPASTPARPASSSGLHAPALTSSSSKQLAAPRPAASARPSSSSAPSTTAPPPQSTTSLLPTQPAAPLPRAADGATAPHPHAAPTSPPRARPHGDDGGGVPTPLEVPDATPGALPTPPFHGPPPPEPEAAAAARLLHAQRPPKSFLRDVLLHAPGAAAPGAAAGPGAMAAAAAAESGREGAGEGASVWVPSAVAKVAARRALTGPVVAQPQHWQEGDGGKAGGGGAAAALLWGQVWAAGRVGGLERRSGGWEERAVGPLVEVGRGTGGAAVHAAAAAGGGGVAHGLVDGGHGERGGAAAAAAAPLHAEEERGARGSGSSGGQPIDGAPDAPGHAAVQAPHPPHRPCHGNVTAAVAVSPPAAALRVPVATPPAPQARVLAAMQAADLQDQEVRCRNTSTCAADRSSDERNITGWGTTAASDALLRLRQECVR